MKYLSPQIEALMKNKKQNSLVKKENSCGIFQDYGKNLRQISEEENRLGLVLDKKVK